MELSNEILSDLVSKYNKGSTLDELSLVYKKSRYKIRKFMFENGVNIRRKGSKYPFVENIFENINTQDKAYWLGFIYADGCIIEKSGGHDVLMFTLKNSDYNHLHKFCEFIELDKEKVKIYGDTCRLEVSSNKMINDLMEHGVSYRKTFELKYPNIDIKLMKHFIRGYFDGDGCLSITNNNKIFKLIGTEDLVKNIQKYLVNHVENITEVKLIEESNMFNYYKNGKNQVLNIMKHIYSNPKTFLNRKMEIYKKLKTTI